MNTQTSFNPEQEMPKTPSETRITAQPFNGLRVAWFLGLAFGLTWLLDLGLYLAGGLTSPSAALLLQLQMLLPAFSAMLLGAFFFQDSPIFYRTNRGVSRWFVYFYLLLTGLYVAGAIVSLVQPDLTTTLAAVLLIPNLLGLILLIVLRVKGGRNAFVDAGMAGGRARIWFGYGLGLVAFFALQSWLNYVFKLGTLVDLKATYPQLAAANMPTFALYLTMALNTVVIGPFLGLIITFGEEYGWRGFLQSELIKLGRVRGVFLLGVIWGIWHWPMIWMGYNYPGQPVLGSLMMVAYCIVLAYFLAYAVFKSKGVWTAAYLHALNNQALSFFLMAAVTPINRLYSFGMGLPGLLLAALVVVLILRDPIWKATE
ncbi:MAG: CPBP family intramembrane metalloprotease [Chloroflexi bacterium]|nr:CPBP family intramembrane metalloprotease [Chloroflexota bacterium]